MPIRHALLLILALCAPAHAFSTLDGTPPRFSAEQLALYYYMSDAMARYWQPVCAAAGSPRAAEIETARQDLVRANPQIHGYALELVRTRSGGTLDEYDDRLRQEERADHERLDPEQVLQRCEGLPEMLNTVREGYPAMFEEALSAASPADDASGGDAGPVTQVTADEYAQSAFDFFRLVRMVGLAQRLCAADKHPQAAAIGAMQPELLQRRPRLYRAGERIALERFPSVSKTALDQAMLESEIAEWRGLRPNARKKRCAEAPEDLRNLMEAFYRGPENDAQPVTEP